MYTERECPAYALHTTIKEEVDHFMEDGLETELRFHENVYDAMWEEADVCFEGDPELNRAVRFNIFHLMSTGNETDDRVSVGAKLLTGEEYGGHAFWDIELFMLRSFLMCSQRWHRIWRITAIIFWMRQERTQGKTVIRARSIHGSPRTMGQSSVRTGPLSRTAPATAAIWQCTSTM